MFIIFESFQWLGKLPFHHKWNEAQSLVINNIPGFLESGCMPDPGCRTPNTGPRALGFRTPDTPADCLRRESEPSPRFRLIRGKPNIHPCTQCTTMTPRGAWAITSVVLKIRNIEFQSSWVIMNCKWIVYLLNHRWKGIIWYLQN